MVTKRTIFGSVAAGALALSALWVVPAVAQSGGGGPAAAAAVAAAADPTGGGARAGSFRADVLAQLGLDRAQVDDAVRAVATQRLQAAADAGKVDPALAQGAIDAIAAHDLRSWLQDHRDELVKSALDRAVADGRITQDQADSLAGRAGGGGRHPLRRLLGAGLGIHS